MFLEERLGQEGEKSIPTVKRLEREFNEGYTSVRELTQTIEDTTLFGLNSSSEIDLSIKIETYVNSRNSFSAFNLGVRAYELLHRNEASNIRRVWEELYHINT